jgi:hypothetical protein
MFNHTGQWIRGFEWMDGLMMLVFVKDANAVPLTCLVELLAGLLQGREDGQ